MHTTTAPSKTLSAWLAIGLGSLGLHRYYLGNRYWWLYALPLAVTLPILLQMEDWLTSPVLLLPVAVVLITHLEGIIFALTPDAKWTHKWTQKRDQKWGQGDHPEAEAPNQSGWGAVWAAIIGLMFGAGLLMTMLAIHIQRWLVDGVVR